MTPVRHNWVSLKRSLTEKYKGRATTARAKTELFLEMVRVQGKTLEAVAEELKITARSVFRIMRDHRVSEKAPVERAA